MRLMRLIIRIMRLQIRIMCLPKLGPHDAWYVFVMCECVQKGSSNLTIRMMWECVLSGEKICDSRMCCLLYLLLWTTILEKQNKT